MERKQIPPTYLLVVSLISCLVFGALMGIRKEVSSNFQVGIVSIAGLFFAITIFCSIRYGQARAKR